MCEINLSEAELKELREKAESADFWKEEARVFAKNSDYWRAETAKYKSIMDRLVVEEKCKWQHEADVDWKVDQSPEYHDGSCLYCHGTGYTTRPATPSEVRELVEWVLSAFDFIGDKFSRNESGWYFLLKSGGRMRLEK